MPAMQAKMLYRYTALTILKVNKMRKTLIIAIVVAVLIAVIAGGYLACTYFSNPTQNPNNPETAPSVEQIRDQAMTYIAANHTLTMPLMQTFHWSGGRQDTDLMGSEIYQYTGGNWTIKLQYPVVPNPDYTITANYSDGSCFFDWTGTYHNSIMTQTSSSDTDPQAMLTQEQIRDLTMQYLMAYHNQTNQYMHDLTWTGGRMDMGMMVGSDKYSYQSSGWNVTMQNPVVPNPIYTITAQYTSMNMQSGNMVIDWQGTLQNGTITQTSYTYKP